MTPIEVLVVDLSTRGGGTQARVRSLAAMNEQGVAVRVACASGSELDVRLASEGIAHYRLRSRKWNPFAAIEIARLVRRERVQVVDAHNVHAQLWGSIAALAGGTVRRVATVHSNYREELSPARRGLMYEQVLRLANLVGTDFVSVSTSVDSYLREVGIAPERIRRIRNGVGVPVVRAGREETRAALDVSPDASLVVVPARLIPSKGHDVLIAAVERLVERHPDLVVVCLGEGESRGILEMDVRSRGLASVVRFVGFRSDVVDVVAAADVCCLPSFTEGLPFALLEAAMLGVPIVATAVGETPELLRNDREAVLVAPGDVDALAAGLDRVIVDGVLAHRLATAARDRVGREATLDVMLGAIARCYLASRPRARWKRAARTCTERAMSSGSGVATVRVLRRAKPVRGQVAVLTYHRVAPIEEDDHLEPQLRSADVAGFRAQMQMLADEFNVITAADLVRAARGGSVPDNAAVVTFDDAYSSVAEYAWPVLREFDLPAITFVPTAFPSEDMGEFWWDRLYRAFRRAAPQILETEAGVVVLDGSQQGARAATRTVSRWVKSLSDDRVLVEVDGLVDSRGGVPAGKSIASWATLRRLHDEGMTLAPHGRMHAIWPRTDDAQLATELEGPRADLMAQVGCCPPMLAYPAGIVTPRVREQVARAGYEIAMTSNHGLNPVRNTDWLMVRRVEVSSRLDAAALRVLLHPRMGRAAARLA